MLHMEFLKGKRLYFVFISELIFISGISTPTFSALTLEISLWIVCRFFFSVGNPNLPLSNLSPSFDYSAA